jgi:hypothetical protein
MTTRIFNRPKRVCADPVHTNSVAFVFIPQESALLSRASQPTMASAIGYGKPELSTLLGSGTFYFALTPTAYDDVMMAFPATALLRSSFHAAFNENF